MSLPLTSDSLPVASIAFFGRTFEEYLRFFALAPSAIPGRRILDAAAGPSSFTAQACALGASAVAVDPLYGCPADTLAAYIQLDYARMLAAMREKASLLRFRAFPSVEASEKSRRAAADAFMSDYEEGFLRGRYVGGALPRLPFDDGTFDLVLCAHLLFLYARSLDYAWHLAACRELVRVGSGEVRIHPVCGLEGRPYPALARLQEDLGRGGVSARVVPVDYEFFAGTDAMLVLESS